MTLINEFRYTFFFRAAPLLPNREGTRNAFNPTRFFYALSGDLAKVTKDGR